MATTQYTIQVGNEIIKFEGPDGLTDDQIEQLADQQLRTAKPGQRFPHSHFVPPDPEIQVHAPNESSVVGSFIRNLPHDATFGWGDELAAASNAAIPFMGVFENNTGVSGGNQRGPESGGTFWDRFQNNMNDYEAQQRADDALHPVASSTGRVLGLLGSIPRAGAAVAARLPQAALSAMEASPILTAMGLGGATGAVSGAGEGRGNRAQSAALGGMTGTVLGAAVAGGMELLPVIARYGKIFLNKASHTEAVQQIVKALQRDGFDVTSPSGVTKLKSALQEYIGKPVSLADIGGATRSRAGVGLRAPSDVQQQGIDQVYNRSAGQTQRLANDIRSTVAPRTDVHALDDALVAQRAQEAEALREKALFESAPDPAAALEDGVERTVARDVVPTRENPVVAGGRQSRIVLDPQLQQLARLPLSQRALKGALDQVNAERDLLAVQGKDISHLPDLHAGSDLDMRAFDYLKRYLDDEVNSLYKRGESRSFTAGEAQQVKALRDTIRERLRTEVPEYADYLDAYKGSSEMIDALREGGEYGNLAPEEIISQQAGRSEAGRELYRVGAARNLLDVLRSSKDTANPASRILNSDESRAQLAATGVSPADMARLNRSVAQERVLNLLPRELSGSDTAKRLAAQEDADAGAHVPLPFNPGSPYGWAGALIRGVLNRTSVNRNAAINNELLPRLLETNPQAIEGIISELELQGKLDQARILRQALRARQTSAVGGTLIGGPVALPTLEDE